jgi:hypothetical protein
VGGGELAGGGEVAGRDVTGGEVTGGEVTGGDVAGGDVAGATAKPEPVTVTEVPGCAVEGVSVITGLAAASFAVTVGA